MKQLGQDFIDCSITVQSYTDTMDKIKQDLDETMSKIEDKFEAKVNKPKRVKLAPQESDLTKELDSVFLVNFRYNRIIGYVGNVKIFKSGAIIADSITAVKTMPICDVQEAITSESTESECKKTLTRYKVCKDTVTNINRSSSDMILKFKASVLVD